MAIIETLTERNADFAAHQFAAGLPIMPTLRTMIIGCVDPAHILGLGFGEAIVIRNIGGRIVPAALQAMAMLQAIAQTTGTASGGGFTLIVLHHTDCGITRLTGKPDMLASYFGISAADLAAKAITDPHASVAVDVAALKATPAFPAIWTAAGLVYDVASGKVETVVAPTPIREQTVTA